MSDARGYVNARDNLEAYRQVVADLKAHKALFDEDDVAAVAKALDIEDAGIEDPCPCNAPVPPHEREDHDSEIDRLHDNYLRNRKDE